MRSFPFLVVVFVALVSADKLQKTVGPCILGKCPDGFKCSESMCLPDMTKMEKLGACVNTLCPDGYSCFDDSCLRPIPKKREGTSAIGPCVNLQCPSKHFCVSSENQCYPL